MLFFFCNVAFIKSIIMDRVIKFRGKRVDNGEWVYGSFLQFHPHHFARKNTTIVEGGCIYNEVDPSTVGQFTGLHDKDGNEIYEGDVIAVLEKHYNESDNEVWDLTGSYQVKWYGEDDYPAFDLDRYPSGCECNGLSDLLSNPEYDEWWNYKVIGNIHDNPELLKS